LRSSFSRTPNRRVTDFTDKTCLSKAASFRAYDKRFS
jgi:hypothetical protein